MSQLFHSKLYLERNVLTELLRREIMMSTDFMSQKRAGLNSQAIKNRTINTKLHLIL